eukprot:scaffold78876_cov54-Phaeocystis_antarctica.AAC.1
MVGTAMVSTAMVSIAMCHLLRAEALHRHAQARLDVLEAVGLVDDEVLPRHRAQHALLEQQRLVGRHHDVEEVARPLATPWAGRRVPEALEDERAVCGGAVQDDGAEGGPRPQLARPVVDGGEGSDDEEGAGGAEVMDVAQRGDALRRLAEPHLVGEQHVPPLVPAVHHPVDALQLVRAQLPVLVGAVGGRLLEVLVARRPDGGHGGGGRHARRPLRRIEGGELRRAGRQRGLALPAALAPRQHLPLDQKLGAAIGPAPRRQHLLHLQRALG